MKGAGPFGFFWILLDLGEELGITKPLVLATPGHITKASYERGRHRYERGALLASV